MTFWFQVIRLNVVCYIVASGSLNAVIFFRHLPTYLFTVDISLLLLKYTPLLLVINHFFLQKLKLAK